MRKRWASLRTTMLVVALLWWPILAYILGQVYGPMNELWWISIAIYLLVGLETGLHGTVIGALLGGLVGPSCLNSLVNGGVVRHLGALFWSSVAGMSVGFLVDQKRKKRLLKQPTAMKTDASAN